MNINEFLTAVSKGDYYGVTCGLKAGFTAESRASENSDCALDLALKGQHPSISELLIDHLVGLMKDKPKENEPIAIVGMACRFAGSADNVENYWSSLIAGANQTQNMPVNRLVINKKAKTYNASFLKNDIREFDADFFRISPSEAHVMDPQQRILLEEVYHAFENGGFDPTALHDSKVGIYVGQMTHDYIDIINHETENVDARLATGNIGSVLSGRLSYLFNFTGESLTVNTACSSSLVAVHIAMNSLRRGDVDMALAAGVNAIIDPRMLETAEKAGMTASDGVCKTFSEQANGYGRGEGVGVILLKRLIDARRDGDSVLSIITGSAVNQDGASSQLTAPNRDQQVAVINSALAKAEIIADQLDVIEAHGTGTPIGDPIEISALNKVFAGRDQSLAPVQVTSVKANIGHCEAAAGVASIIKMVLALNHQKLPGQINLNHINPKLDLASGLITIPTKAVDWKPASDRPRRAGVSSYGFSGTNAHIILQEPPQHELLKKARLDYQWRSLDNYPVPNKPSINATKQLLVLSAKSQQSLQLLIAKYIVFIKNANALELPNICYTASAGREHHKFRQAYLVTSLDELLNQLQNGSKQIPQQSKANPVTFNLSDLTDEQLKSCQQWMKEDAYYYSIIYHYEHNIDLSIIDDPIKTWSTTQRQIYALLFQLAAIKRYASCGITADHNEASGVGVLVKAVAQKEMSLLNALQKSATLNAAANTIHSANSHSIANGRDAFITAVAQCYSSGIRINWQAFWKGSICTKQVLPDYPFNRRVYWFDKVLTKRRMNTTSHPTQPIYMAGGQMIFQHRIALKDAQQEFLSGHKVGGKIIYPAAAYLNLIIKLGSTFIHDQNITVENLQFIQPMILTGETATVCQIKFKPMTSFSGKYAIEISSFQEGMDASQAKINAQAITRVSQTNEIAAPDIQAIQNGGEVINSTTLYQQLSRLQLQYGKSWQLIDKAWLRDNQVIAEINSAKRAELTDTATITLYDSALHPAILLISADELNKFPSLVPQSFENVQILGDIDETALVMATRTDHALEMTFQIQMLSAAGKVLAIINQYKIAKYETKAEAAFDPAEVFYALDWQESALTSLLNPVLALNPKLNLTKLPVAHVNQEDLPKKDNQFLYQYGLSVIKLLVVKRWPSLQNSGAIININQPETGVKPAAYLAGFIRKCFIYLAEAGLVHLENNTVRVVKVLASVTEIQQQISAYPIDPNDAQAQFLVAVTSKIDAVLDNQLDALALLFPKSVAETSPTHASYIYQHTQDAFIANAMCHHVMQYLAEHVTDKPLRILEIGAGTGATTKAIMPILKKLKQVQYFYTDVSSRFINNCHDCLGDSEVNYQFRLFNIEKSPYEQGFADQQFDIIIATNVLHVSINLETTLTNLHGLLIDKGVMILSETTVDSPWLDLTFGLTEGWWHFNDEYRKSSPLLSKTVWHHLLSQVGFDCEATLGEAQSVFVARANSSLSLHKKLRRNTNNFIVAYSENAAQSLVSALAENNETATVILLSPVQQRLSTNDINAMKAANWPNVFFISPQHEVTTLGMEGYQQMLCQPLLTILQTLDAKRAKITAITVQARGAHPEQITATGLISSAANENRNWQLKIIDIDSALNTVTAKQVIRLSGQASDETELCVHGNLVLTPSIIKKSLQHKQSVTKTPDYNDLLVITGGAGEVGQALLADLVAQGYYRFALIMRNRPTTLELNYPDKVKIRIYIDDLSNQQQLFQTWSQIKNDMGEVHGVYHLAGTLADHLVKDMDWDSIKKVFAAKVMGSYHLHLLTTQEPVKQFVLFSSVAAFFSSPGQMNHVAANRYLDSLAQHRQSLGLAAQSINWGFWSEIGSAVKRNALAIGAKKGYLALSPAQAFTALHQVITSNTPNVIVAKFNWMTYFAQLNNSSIPALFQAMAHHYQVNVTQIKKEYDFDKFKTDYPSEQEQKNEVFKFIVNTLRKVLMLQNDYAIEAEFQLKDFPVKIDSIAGISIISEINEYYSLTETDHALTSNSLYTNDSLVEFAEKLLKIISLCHSRAVLSDTKVDRKSTSTAPATTVSDEIPPANQIAIVGMSFRFPQANNSQELWKFLHSSIDPVTEAPASRLGKSCYYNATAENLIPANAGFLAVDISQFDADFFNISSEEAETMDPQQRLLLELTWEALANAGIAPATLAGTKTSVSIGISANEFGDLLLHHSEDDQLSRFHSTGNNTSASVGRLSYQLGLKGPNMAVNTACSSSLVSIDIACKHLNNGNADLAICGASNIILSPKQMRLYATNGMLSATKQCHTFSDQADGMVRSEGCAIFILKPIKKAVLDNNRILGVIESSTVNQNGSGITFMAPDLDAQRELHRQSLQQAGLKGADIDYVEAHGTGTKLGDPVEVEALVQELGNSEQKLSIGAIKSNLGHAEAAAGAAGLTKVILALQNQVIPPNRFSGKINSSLMPFTKSVEFINTSKAWLPNESRTRRALISSFGFSGTNAEIIVAEPPKLIPKPANLQQHAALQKRIAPWAAIPLQVNTATSQEQLIVISAKSPSALTENLVNLRNYIQDEKDNSPLSLTDLAYTLSNGRDHYSLRVAFPAKSIDDLLSQMDFRLAQLAIPAKAETLKTAFLFTGQGSQYKNMSFELFQTNMLYRSVFAYCDQILAQYLDHSLNEIIFGEDAAKFLEQTEYTQPAIFVLEYALALMWMAYGVQPQYVMGHSVGEYVAATLAGCMTLEDALKLICVRGKIMAKAPAGKMLVINCGAERAQTLLTENQIELDVAGINTPSQTVLAGSNDAAQKALVLFKSKGLVASYLKVEKAFHSRLMAPVLEEFKQTADQINYAAPKHCIFISTLTGGRINQALSAEHWTQHLRQGVNFVGAMQTIDQLSANLYLELGPKPILTALAKKCLTQNGQKNIWLESCKEIASDHQQLLHSLMLFYLAGGNINWLTYWNGRPATVIDAPYYAFQKQTYWPKVLGGKQALLTHKAQARTAIQAIAVPLSEHEQKVCACLSECLQKPISDIKKTFNDYGGSSLNLPDFQTMLMMRFGIHVTAKVLSDMTLIDIAKQVAISPSKTLATDAVANPADWYKPFPLNQIQYAYWIGRQGILPLGNVSAHGYLEVIVTDLDIQKLESALNKLINHHAMLRMTVDDKGMQVIQETVPSYKISVIDLSFVNNPDQLLAQTRNELSHQVKDASVWPLFDIRISLSKDRAARLHMSFDSLVLDMYSLRLLFDDWYKLYQDPNYNLAPLTYTFRDYHLALDDYKQSEKYQTAKAYWQDKVKTMPLGPELPLLCEPSQVVKQTFARCESVINQVEWGVFKNKAKAAGVSPTSILLSLFAIVLGRFSSNNQFLINLTLFRRTPFHAEVKKILGDFTNVEVFHANSESCYQQDFMQIAKRDFARLTADLEHVDYHGVDVQRDLMIQHKLENQQSVAPVVFTSLLNLTLDRTDNPTNNKKSASVWQQFGKVEFSITQTPQVWLDNKIFESDEGLVIEWDYVESLFDPKIMQAMHRYFISYVQHLCQSNWNEPLPDLITAAELNKQREASATQVCAYLNQPSLTQLIETKLKEHASALAVFDENRRLSYQQLDQASADLAMQLQAKGLTKGQFVGVSVERSTYLIVAIIGVLRAGGVYLPIEDTLPQERRDYMLTNSQASLIIVNESTKKTWQDHQDKLVLIDSLDVSTSELYPVDIQPTDLAYLLYTSGSSGKPKGVMIEHRAVVNRLLWMKDQYDINRSDIFIQKTPISFDVSIWELYLPFLSGAALFMPKADGHKDVNYLQGVMSKHQITRAHFIPSMLEIFIQQVSGKQLPSLKTVYCSGEALLPGHVNQFNAKFPQAQLENLYGPTEAAVDVTYWSAPKHEVKAVPIGKPIANVGILILDKQGLPCPQGVVGELCLIGVQLARGYLNLPEKTAAAFTPNPFSLATSNQRIYHTGDNVFLTDDLTIMYLGRSDDQIKINGQRIELGEIQEVINQVPGISQSAVLPVDIAGNPKTLVGFIKHDMAPSLAEHQANLASAIADLEQRDAFKATNHSVSNQLRPLVTIATGAELNDKNALQLFKRKSYRSFEGENLTLTDLQNFLRNENEVADLRLKVKPSVKRLVNSIAAYQTKTMILPKYSYPSAGSLYPVKCYLAIGLNEEGFQPGYYIYNQQDHQLESYFELNNTLPPAGISIALVAHKKLIVPMYGEYWKKFALIEAGAMTARFQQQNLLMGSDLQSSENSEWLRQFSFISTDDLICSHWHWQPNRMQNRLDPLPSCQLWVCITKQIDQAVPGLYRWKDNKLQLEVKQPYPLAIHLDGDNAQIVTAATAIIFFTGSLSQPNQLLDAGQHMMALMQQSETKLVGMCPLGFCPIPQTYAQIVNADVLQAMVLGPISQAQLNSQQTSTPSKRVETMLSHLQQKLQNSSLTSAMRPERFITVASFPLTHNGKLDRKTLIKMAQEQLQSVSTQLQAPRNLLEEQVHQQWANTLQPHKYDVNKSFFAAGGNSISVNKLLNNLNAYFNLSLTLVEVYQHNSIAKLALLIDIKQDQSWKVSGANPIEGIIERDNANLLEKLLMAKRIDLKKQDQQGRTSLYIAAMLNRENIVKLLLRYSADFSLAKHSGTTPAECARRNGYSTIVGLFAAAEAAKKVTPILNKVGLYSTPFTPDVTESVKMLPSNTGTLTYAN